MKEAVIDIGSNSMRLTVYEVEEKNFKILFKEKFMAALAGYVESGCISEAGILRACTGLLEFKNTLRLLSLDEHVHVFATASLRNIVNTDDALAQIKMRTGFDIDVITGEEETVLGYVGVMHEIAASEGVFIDIGGASTEIAIFDDHGLLFSNSFRIGSLKLYKDCVKKILPGKGSLKRIEKEIDEAIPSDFDDFGKKKQLICTGGTARSVLKFAKFLQLVSDDEQLLSYEHLKKIKELFLGDEKKAANVILKVDPERIHTIIPGFMILYDIADRFQVEKLMICNYGVREGYLCQRILR
ncbi:hypothetical protein [uncultured Traorella sp.]|uniref:Ppx/GppA phosphatase family protein n=1 Tax=uncultured Traorella sp. TaxID=1929048 RepID=UPI0025EA53CC|nr:hypothetical protein [uncultured Traorella sp.]